MTTGQDRLTIAEAAKRLDLTPEAVRKRIKRGTVQAVKDGRLWFVLLDREQDTARTVQDGRTDTIRDSGQDNLIEALRAHIASLERQAAADSIERQELRQLLAMAQRQLPPGKDGAEDTIEPTPKRRRWWPFNRD